MHNAAQDDNVLNADVLVRGQHVRFWTQYNAHPNLGELLGAARRRRPDSTGHRAERVWYGKP